MATQPARTVKLLAAAALVVSVYVYRHDTRPGAIAGPQSVQAAPTVTTVLFAAGSCWRRQVPADVRGQIPPRALVLLPGEGPRLVGATVGFDVWQGKRPGTLYGFCR